MWTPREKELCTIGEIETYLEKENDFHDYRLGGLTYISENATAQIGIETDHDPKKSSSEGIVWLFEFTGIKNIRIDTDEMLDSWVSEITVKEGNEVFFSLTNGFISILCEKVKLGIPSNAKQPKKEKDMPRVHILREKYMIQDLSNWVMGKMRTQKKSQAYMGQLLGISQAAYGKRLKNANFNYTQLIKILRELDATDEEILKIMKM